MKIKKTLLVAGAASTIGITSFAGVAAASAQSSDGTTANTLGQQGLVEKIANKFNLNKDEVQAVFDQDREEHRQQMQKQLEARLNKAVSEGKLTSSQKTLILDKLKELQTYRQSLEDKTHQERRKLMEEKRTELQQWAKDNNISEEYLRPTGEPGGQGRHGYRVNGNQDGQSQN